MVDLGDHSTRRGSPWFLVLVRRGLFMGEKRGIHGIDSVRSDGIVGNASTASLSFQGSALAASLFSLAQQWFRFEASTFGVRVLLLLVGQTPLQELMDDGKCGGQATDMPLLVDDVGRIGVTDFGLVFHCGKVS